MTSRIALAGLLAPALLLMLSAAPEVKPAEYKAGGSFAGGSSTSGMALVGVRFGVYPDFTRMVLDLENVDPEMKLRSPATTHPFYRVEYCEFPYRLVISLAGVRLDPQADIQSEPALPFSVITKTDLAIKQMQVFLSGPSEFKVIEIDDPAKLSIDIRPRVAAVPSVFTVQLTGPATAAEAFALVEQGRFPPGYAPDVLVLGKVVVVEQAFKDAAAAAEIDSALHEMGYATVINERRGSELPQR